MAPPLRLLRAANPVVRSVLRSPAHGVLSHALVLLERSGGRAPIPLLAAQVDGGLVALAVAPDRKRWWRRFRTPTLAALTVRRQSLGVVGEVLDGARRRDALRSYVARFPRTRRSLGLPGDGSASDEALDAVDAAVVLFREAV